MSPGETTPPALEASGLRMAFESPGGGLVEVLAGIDLVVPAGGTAAITGPSGSGKSTLLGILGGLSKPTAGSVSIRGKSIGGLAERELARVRNRDVGFVFQLHHLLPQCTALENALVPALAGHGTKADASTVERAQELLDRAGLLHKVNHLPSELSVGERQRVAVVRAIVNKPCLLLADEPTGALDAATAASLTDLLLDANRAEGIALLVATHSLELASRMGTAYALKGGKLVPGSPGDLACSRN